MSKLIFSFCLLLQLSSSIYALEIGLQGAKENFENYSILNIKDKNKFLCQEIKNDFGEVSKVICAFSKSPSKKFKPLQNDFFKIKTQIKKKTFFLIITPYKKMKLYPVVFNLSKDDEVYSADVKLSSSWMLVGYKKKIPFMYKDDPSPMSINFPFFLSKDKLPYVGSLDMKGNPVHIKNVGDVSNYLKIKRYYKEEKYEKCLDLIEDVMYEFPSSLFTAELLYYKIRASAKLNNDDDVIDYSKIYLREYSSDENIAEVLALCARSYSQNGLNSQADYFFDRLFSEHKDSPYSKWGYIYKGEMLEESGGFKKAVMYYTKALRETQSIETASTAAFKLAQYYIGNGQKKDASKYVAKIIKAKPDFFIGEYESSLKMMDLFADMQVYSSAASIAKALLDSMDKRDDYYETLLKNIGIWLSQTTKKQEALTALNRYFEKYPDGLFDEEVQIAKDSLFFDNNDANLSIKIKTYNELIDTYKDDSIGDRAIYEKAKLMRDNEMYNDVLESKDTLLNLDETIYKDTKEIVNDAALGAMKQALKKQKCKRVLNISSEYAISLSDDWDDGIYECAMKGADFLLAKKVIGKNLNSKDIQMRKKWLYRYIKVDFATGNYSDVVKASQELLVLIKDDKDSKYKDVYRVVFDTYQRLEKNKQMIDAIVKLEKEFGKSYKDIERYVAVMNIGSQTKDDNLVLRYGEEVMKIQKKSDSYAQSPFVEFTLYQTYINREDYSKALEVIESLDTLELSKDDRARQKYLLGTLNDKLWREDEAQVAYKEAIDADPTSAWASLAKDAKE
ncbi:MAG: flagellar protein [Sulfurimonas sp.]|nr:flagellar protein [Sulfurimonas sp.]